MDYNQLRRLNIIVERLSSISNPSFDDLMQALVDRDTQIVQRTLRRDIKALRDVFGLDIEYDPQKKRYRLPKTIDSEQKQLIDFFAKLDAAYYQTSLGLDHKTADKIIAYDQVDWETGFRHVQTVVKAIMLKRVLHFEYSNYNTLETQERKLQPYVLKEHDRTWYMVGTIPGDNPKYYIFGLDRVKSLSMSLDTFVAEDKEVRAMLDEHIGANLEQKLTAQRVRFKAYGIIGQLIKRKPLHPTQTAVDVEGGVEILLYVRPNIALEQMILKHGELIQVLEPLSLVESIRKRISLMSDCYRDDVL
jgi:predicted DNA-binding transcriptional regulator YafY